ncbi:EAL domain-containing protein [Bacillus sp. 1NLA3E]|uniref:EAL domain-containing protein n=1 Tax=Bacillus sp. 1NLA3E TaxID=666686 RepID=UPI000247ED94|nr:EAL domain-containing protein [Bacillus sp. 1NLA3E]AGK53543.1 signaling protein [Bacillus sp. 1NLA3E]
MNTTNLKRKLFILIYFVTFSIFLYYWKGHPIVSLIGTCVFSSIAYAISTTWLISSFRKITGKQRYIWLWLGLCGFCLLVAQLYWTIYQITFQTIPYGNLGDLIRLIGYVMNLIALFYVMKVMKDTIPMIAFLFHVVILMIVGFSICWSFIIHPILNYPRELSVLSSSISTGYILLDASLFFAIICLLYSSFNPAVRKVFYMISLPLLIQIMADAFYNYQSYYEKYTNGNYVNLLWPMAQLLMGLSALLSREFQWIQRESRMKIGSPENKGFYITYISSGLFLIVSLVYHQGKLDVLQIGIYLIMLLLLFKQVFSTIENRRMIEKLYRLAGSESTNQTGTGSTKRGNYIQGLFLKIEELVHFDALTKLANNSLFHKRVQLEIDLMQHREGKFSILFIDMDRFKNINDRLGHHGGNLLLQQIADRFCSTLGGKAMISRMSGDEFTILLPDTNQQKSILVAEKIIHEFSKPFFIKGNEVYSTASIGISIYPDHGNDVDVLMKNADTAMYLAKEEGKNQFKIFSVTLQQKQTRRIELESQLRRAIQQEQFLLYYQPLVELGSGGVVGTEALIRWNHPELGMISPLEFIPLAEDTGLIEPIGTWVMKTACQQMKEWQEAGLTNIFISVNVSAKQFKDPLFTSKVVGILSETGLDPHLLKIELTESVLQDIEIMIPILMRLKDLGVKIAIDDFGTGYSSLAYLKHLPIDCLKIDKAFIDELIDNPEGPLVKTIMSMGKNLQYEVIAEGIETKEQVKFLKEIDCVLGQGYYYSRPLSATEFESYVNESYLTAAVS